MVGGLATLHVDIEAFEILLQNEVDHAHHGVGTIDGRGATGDVLDARDGNRRNGIDVDVQEGVGRLSATPVEQHEAAVRAQAAQVQDRRAGIAGGATLDARRELVAASTGVELRHFIEGGLNSGICGVLERVLGDGDDRTGRVQVTRSNDARTRDGDFS